MAVMENPVIAGLERALAANSSDTPQHQFARAKLSAILGEIGAAATSLQELLQK